MGTNSVHAIFAELMASGGFRILGREKELVRLGDGTMVTRRLNADAMAAALSAMQRIVHLAKHRGMEKIIAVATSAIREAVNGGTLLDRIRDETRVKVKIITGEEEGRLIYLAIKNSLEFNGRNALIIDIGGGSTEIICGSNQKSFWIESLKLGANRLSQTFPFSDPPTKSEIDKLEEHVRQKLKIIDKRWSQDKKAEFLVGSSGTLQNLASMVLADRGEADLTARNTEVTRDELKAKIKELAGMDMARRQKARGLDARRADMILHGLVVLNELMKTTGLERIVVCDKALREGLIYDTIEKNRKRLQIEQDIPDVRRRSVITLQRLCEEDLQHANQSARLSLALYDALKDEHGFKAKERELLEYAALLHDIGYHISYDKHHKHAYYLIKNADLTGFTSEEITTIAWVARLHRRSVPKRGSEEFSEMTEEQVRTIRYLGGILRVADALDHSHFSLVKNISVNTSKNEITITLYSDAEIQWEIHEATIRKDLLEKESGKNIVIEHKQE